MSSAFAEEQQWIFEVKLDRPLQVALENGLKGEEGQWVMTYQVKNSTGRDRFLMANIWAIVNKDEKRKHPDHLMPKLEHEVERTSDTKFGNHIESMGKIKAGATLKCIALFGYFGYDVQTIDVYIDGVAEETLARDLDGNYFIRTRRVHGQFHRAGDPEKEPFPTMLRGRQEVLFIERPIPKPE